MSAADVLAGRLAPGQLANKIVLVGTTAPGLLDLRVTPVGETYPGVETHANLIAGLLDGELITQPDYALGYELVVLVAAGLLAGPGLASAQRGPRGGARAWPWWRPSSGLNTWLYLGHGLVLPLASTLVMAGLAFALNMSYGYLVESRSKRELAQLFGTYVPPTLVEEMVKDPASYSMQAQTRELTVMFCDMRGFTQIAETLSPTALQALLNQVFSRLTQIIRTHLGTIDKYMGDCVMAFWGAPVDLPDHAHKAVQTALAMAESIHDINRERAAAGPERHRRGPGAQHRRHVCGRHGLGRAPQLHRDRRRGEPGRAAGGAVAPVRRGHRGQRNHPRPGARLCVADAGPGARQRQGPGRGHLHPAVPARPAVARAGR